MFGCWVREGVVCCGMGGEGGGGVLGCGERVGVGGLGGGRGAGWSGRASS